MQSTDALFTQADLIASYTRADALADGALIDVSAIAREAGFRVPVAITAAAWADCVTWSDADTKRQCYQDQDGRLWDVLWMGFQGIRRTPNASECRFALLRVPRGGRRRTPIQTSLRAVIGPGDAGEPVVTIMLPTED